jgi:hypothetical protein
MKLRIQIMLKCTHRFEGERSVRTLLEAATPHRRSRIVNIEILHVLCPGVATVLPAAKPAHCEAFRMFRMSVRAWTVACLSYRSIC